MTQHVHNVPQVTIWTMIFVSCAQKHLMVVLYAQAVHVLIVKQTIS